MSGSGAISTLVPPPWWLSWAYLTHCPGFGQQHTCGYLQPVPPWDPLPGLAPGLASPSNREVDRRDWVEALRTKSTSPCSLAASYSSAAANSPLLNFTPAQPRSMWNNLEKGFHHFLPSFFPLSALWVTALKMKVIMAAGRGSNHLIVRVLNLEVIPKPSSLSHPLFNSPIFTYLIISQIYWFPIFHCCHDPHHRPYSFSEIMKAWHLTLHLSSFFH